MNPQIVGDFSRVIMINRSGGSLDPGLFTLLLRYWSFLGLETWWLRLLPMLFFFLTLGLYFSSLNQRREMTSSLFATMICGLFFTNNLLLDYAFTIRPYIMEVAGCAFLFSLLIREENNGGVLEVKREVLIGLGIAFFMGSRYHFSLLVVLYFLLELFIFKRKTFKELFYRALPGMIFGLVIFWVSFRHQV